MKRRDSIKTLIVTSLASSLVLEGCLPKEKEIIYEKIWKYQYGRTSEEKKRDSELLNKYNCLKSASLLRETMWSMVSEITSDIDFDYSEYTENNLKKFEESLKNI